MYRCADYNEMCLGCRATSGFCCEYKVKLMERLSYWYEKLVTIKNRGTIIKNNIHKIVLVPTNEKNNTFNFAN